MSDTAFSKALKVEDDDEEYVDAEDNDWFREVQAGTTPAESLKLLRTTFYLIGALYETR